MILDQNKKNPIEFLMVKKIFLTKSMAYLYDYISKYFFNIHEKILKNHSCLLACQFSIKNLKKNPDSMKNICKTHFGPRKNKKSTVFDYLVSF